MPGVRRIMGLMCRCQILRIVCGFIVSLGIGQLVLWLIVEKGLWTYLRNHHGNNLHHNEHALSWLVGVTERVLYTGALIVGAYQFVGIWLAIKVAARWRTSTRLDEAGTGSDNVWLIGSGLSLLFAFLGAWIALWKLPAFK